MTDVAAPTDVNLIFGDDEYLTGVVYDAADARKDLTASGIALTCTVSTGVPGVTLLSMTIGDGITVDNAGNYSVKISHADKTLLTTMMGNVLRVPFALQLTDTTGDRTTVGWGWLRLYGTAGVAIP